MSNIHLLITIGLYASDISLKRRKGNAITIITTGVTTNVSSSKKMANSDCLLDRVSGIFCFGESDLYIIEKEKIDFT